MWLGGVGLALLPLLYGIRCMVTQRSELGTTVWRSEVEGGAAIAIGVGWIGVGSGKCHELAPPDGVQLF